MRAFFGWNKKREKRSIDMGVARPPWSIQMPFLGRVSRTTVNLRQKIYVRYPLEVLVGFLFVMVAVFLVKSALTKAEVTSFNPATCLGTWQNPTLAKGPPETFGVEGAVPGAENSAAYTESPSYIFCGNFVPPDFEATGTIKSVGLTFAWNVLDVAAPTSTGAEGAPASEESPAFLRHRISFLNRLLKPAYAQETPATEPDQPPPVPIPEPIQFLEIPPAVTEPPTPPSEPPTPPSEPLAPPSETPLGGDVTASTTEDVPADFPDATSSVPGPDDPVTYAPPVPADESFLKVSYTLDGTTWFELSRVNLSNWPNLTLSVPVTDWDELANLQVSIEDIPTTLLPPYPRVFLDGMFLAVTYERPVPAEEIVAEQQAADGEEPLAEPDQNGEVFEEEQAVEEQSPLENILDAVKEMFIDVPLEEPTPLPVPVPVTAPTPPTKFIDAEARHTCSFDPFTLGAQPGGSAAVFAMTLVPSYSGAPFRIEMGRLPSGVEAAINRASGVGTAHPRVSLTATEGAPHGSFTTTVLYHEEQEGGGVLTAACRLNLMVE